ncbi:hypothetical protein MBAV_003940 [Candidatus Magnetobacterium bavaricum]|uniref:Uncharacterized protein n=1 Tax=Candidatus Magnetobacterium bavaricum TaxID=29290 RepID=A0A0F3GPH7_9BACT|nr:hypothetical protein MBAV_003937 [Candidatus Magnetobacterium bavaricum]KJU83869.1 hypothetical protein MBAV_003940 [Candidatus Magnetobacterium bavaricum]
MFAKIPQLNIEPLTPTAYRGPAHHLSADTTDSIHRMLMEALIFCQDKFFTPLHTKTIPQDLYPK